MVICVDSRIFAVEDHVEAVVRDHALDDGEELAQRQSQQVALDCSGCLDVWDVFAREPVVHPVRVAPSGGVFAGR